MKTDEAPAKAPRPTINEVQVTTAPGLRSDAERVAEQRAKAIARRIYQKVIPLTRGEWGEVRASATKRVRVVG